MRRISGLFLFALLAASPAKAQVSSVPTEAPIVSADNEPWYLDGTAIQFEGDDYYPAGAEVFFNADQMVRSGDFEGIPLYTDTTLEPYSIVYVPLSRGLMKPYEKRRQGSMAGTTGSRAPSFPVSVVPTSAAPIEAAAPPTALPLPIGEVDETTLASPTATSGTSVPGAVGTGGIPVIPRPTAVATIPAPRSNEGVWIPYLGQKWFSAGGAVPLTSDFRVVGTYAGFPVFARRRSTEPVIYLPSLDEMIAPYRRRQ